MKRITTWILLLGSAAVFLQPNSAKAEERYRDGYYDRDHRRDWRGHEFREHEYWERVRRERAWREHGRRERLEREYRAPYYNGYAAPSGYYDNDGRWIPNR